MAKPFSNPMMMTTKPIMTVDQWNAYLATQGTFMGLASNFSAYQATAGNHVFTMVPGTGTMWGSSWGAWSTSDSNVSRFIQHACPTLDIYNELATNNIRVYLSTGSFGYLDTTAVTRNGYTSSSYGSFDSAYSTNFRYLYKGVPYLVNPYSQTTPTVITIT